VNLERLGRIDYLDALAWQHEAAEALRAQRGPERLALLEHPPVYTVGARGGREHVLVEADVLASRGARVLDVDRGGDVTFHGPGQLVVYPILDLRARRMHAGDYVRALEECAITSLARFSVEAGRETGRPGVWVPTAEGMAKIAAVGVRIDRGITRHGLALNVNVDLEWFEAIVPCGLEGARVTSMAELLEVAPSVEAVASRSRPGSRRSSHPGSASARSRRCCASPSCTRSARRHAVRTSASASTRAPRRS
jgi:lipoate-protein ligase B